MRNGCFWTRAVDVPDHSAVSRHVWRKVERHPAHRNRSWATSLTAQEMHMMHWKGQDSDWNSAELSMCVFCVMLQHSHHSFVALRCPGPRTTVDVKKCCSICFFIFLVSLLHAVAIRVVINQCLFFSAFVLSHSVARRLLSFHHAFQMLFHERTKNQRYHQMVEGQRTGENERLIGFCSDVQDFSCVAWYHTFASNNFDIRLRSGRPVSRSLRFHVFCVPLNNLCCVHWR